MGHRFILTQLSRISWFHSGFTRCRCRRRCRHHCCRCCRRRHPRLLPRPRAGPALPVAPGSAAAAARVGSSRGVGGATNPGCWAAGRSPPAGSPGGLPWCGSASPCGCGAAGTGGPACGWPRQLPPTSSRSGGGRTPPQLSNGIATCASWWTWDGERTSAHTARPSGGNTPRER